MMVCYPTFREFTDTHPQDAVNADYIRSLCPVGDHCEDPDGGDSPDTPDTPDNADELKAIINSWGLENIMWHWFYQATLFDEGIPWDEVITYLFTDTGTHCEATRDVTADLLEKAGLNWNVFAEGPWLDANRSWMHAEPLGAYFAHWNKCFPDMDVRIEGLTDAETGPAWIRTLVPEFP